MKVCSKCKVSRSEDFFYKNKRSKDGRTNECISCSSLRRIKYKQQDKYFREVNFFHRQKLVNYEKNDMRKECIKKIE